MSISKPPSVPTPPANPGVIAKDWAKDWAQKPSTVARMTRMFRFEIADDDVKVLLTATAIATRMAAATKPTASEMVVATATACCP